MISCREISCISSVVQVAYLERVGQMSASLSAQKFGYSNNWVTNGPVRIHCVEEKSVRVSRYSCLRLNSRLQGTSETTHSALFSGGNSTHTHFMIR